MKMRRFTVRLVATLLVVALATTAYSQLDPLHRLQAEMKTSGPPLYLPSSTTLKLLCVGHETTVADLFYLWAIQWLGDRKHRKLRRAWTARVYNAITDLDLHFRDAYWLGFVSLLQEAREPELAFALVDKALDRNPDYVILAVDAAMTARVMKDTTRAVHYLRRVQQDPSARRLMLRLRDVDWSHDELEAWQSLGRDEAADGHTLAFAASHARDITAFIHCEMLEAVVSCYERERGRRPDSLQQLVMAGYLTEILPDPEGKEYVYSADTGEVRSVEPYRHDPPSRAVRGVDLSFLGDCAPGPSSTESGAAQR